MDHAETLRLIEGLRALGVLTFKGHGIEIELGVLPGNAGHGAPTAAEKAAVPPARIEIEGISVDPDLIGHEVA
jgi:hypothetical protein